LFLWAVTPAAECTINNPEYAAFVDRFKRSRFAGSFECPTGGLTLEQLVLGSYEIDRAQEKASPDCLT
jgi:hypothetical protein